MKLVVGLGNPGKEYAGTRHNIGFELIDALASAHKIKVDGRVAQALAGRGNIVGEALLLAKPQTFMNLSGESVRKLMEREQVGLPDLLVVVDDIHLPPGRLRFRAKGSAGGHNGLKSIAAQLGSQDWARLRLGVGEPSGPQVDWVLSRFSKADRKTADEMLIEALGAVETWIARGIEDAMNRFNADPPAP